MKWRCPYCRRELDVGSPDDMPHWPFCCERCKMADLEGWLSGRYVVSRPVADGDIGEATPADDRPTPGRHGPPASPSPDTDSGNECTRQPRDKDRGRGARS